MTALNPDIVYRDWNTAGVPGSGDYKPLKSDIRKLLKQVAAGTTAVGDYRGAWDSATAYVTSDLVQSGGSIWHALANSTNVTPIEGVSWTLFLPGVTAADGSITVAKLAAAVTQNFVASVATIADMRAVNTSIYTGAIVLEHKKSGNFRRSNADLSATLTSLSVTSTGVNSTTDVITKTAHGLVDCDGVVATTAVNGLALNTVYYVIRVTADTFKLASSFSNARAGTAFDLTGTTNFTVKRLVDPRQGIYVVSTGDELDGSDGCWIREYSGSADVRWFGAVGDGVTDDLASLQATTDLCDAVFIPVGTYPTNGAWLVDDYASLHFESRNAVIQCSATTAVVRARGHTTSRNFNIEIHSGTLRGTSAAGTSCIGLDLVSASLVKVFGTLITYCFIGVRQGGSGSLGALYNEFHSVDITTVTTGYQNGTLGNSNATYGGGVRDCVIGTDDDDNTCNTYNELSVEVFTTGHRVSNSGAISQRIRYMNSRLENGGGVGTGIRIAPSAQSTLIIGEFSAGLATVVSDSGTGTTHLASY